MFENFHQAKVQTTDPEVSINLRYGGGGRLSYLRIQIDTAYRTRHCRSNLMNVLSGTS